MAQQEASTSLTRVNQTYKFLEVQQPIVEKWCASGVRADALVRVTVGELRKNEKLAQCTQESIYAALLSCAVTGLIPGFNGEAYIIPYKNHQKNGVMEARFQAGWKGLVKQVKRAGTRSIRSEAVHANDHFKIDLGVANTVEHSPFLQGARGAVLGAYAWASLHDGSRQIEWMSLEDLEAVERFAKSKSPSSTVWNDWREQMQRKTVIRRLTKFLPVGDDYYRGIELDDAIDDAARVIEILDSATDGAASAVSSRDARSFVQVPAAPTPAAPPPAPRQQNRARNNAKPPIDIPANDSPPPPAQPGVIHNEDGSRQVGGVYVGANGTPHASKPANTSPRNAAAATGPANAPHGAAPAETPPPAPPPDTEPESFDDSGSQEPSGSDGSDESSTDPNGPGADEMPPPDFGEPPPSPPAAPARSVEGFIAWLQTCRTRMELQGPEGVAWRDWSAKSGQVPSGSAEAARMSEAFKARFKELPAR